MTVWMSSQVTVNVDCCVW